jgi:hypothetical protein
MYSIRKSLGLLCASALGLSLVAGCSMGDGDRMAHGWSPGFEQRVNAVVRPSQGRREAVLPDPAADDATRLRDWETDKYIYPSGAVVSGPTYGLNYEDRPRWLRNDYAYAAAQPGILLLDVIALPFWLVAEPPTTLVVNHGVQYPPSMTVAPPLPR